MTSPHAIREETDNTIERSTRRREEGKRKAEESDQARVKISTSAQVKCLDPSKKEYTVDRS
jgi:hypothetical protein